MPTYAYRWADGTITVCSAVDEDEAIELFDQIAPVTRKLIIVLSSRLAITIKPRLTNSWEMDEDSPFGDTLDLELLKSCYPHFNAAYFDGEQEDYVPPDPMPPEVRQRLKQALARDLKDVHRLLDSHPVPPDLVNLFPRGFPGQEN